MTMTPRIIAAIALGLFILAMVVFGPAACNRYLAEKKAGQISRGQGQATLNSMDEAKNTMIVIDETERQIEGETKENRRAVEQAPAGNSNDVADRAACRMRIYVNTERCAALRQADSARAGRGNPAR